MYQLPYQVTFADCDEKGRLTWPRLLDLLMHVSNSQLTSWGLGIGALLQKKLGWVVVRYHFEVNQLPQAGDQVVLSTEDSGHNRFFCYRDFGVAKKDGPQLLKVTSQWVIIDLAQRKMVPPAEAIGEKIKFAGPENVQRFARLHALPAYEKKQQQQVHYFDLDTNRHVDNARYFNWLFDLPGRSFVDNHAVKSIDIQFDEEVKYGDDVYTALQQENDQSFFKITAGDKTAALCVIAWKKG
ncbi:MAG: acyl-[acyl-carrier-protein] thioesterase [Lactobacillus sp.]